ncbi:MAG: hypothetical protein JSS82_12865 [Bacteroidetes bacterium]|nr:hypothetical protein [Bacteroidota bacterium]
MFGLRLWAGTCKTSIPSGITSYNFADPSISIVYSHTPFTRTNDSAVFQIYPDSNNYKLVYYIAGDSIRYIYWERNPENAHDEGISHTQ